jgi:hypothetical protein
VGLRAGLGRCEKSRPHRDSIPGPSSPQAVAIPTELPGLGFYIVRGISWLAEEVQYMKFIYIYISLKLKVGNAIVIASEEATHCSYMFRLNGRGCHLRVN